MMIVNTVNFPQVSIFGWEKRWSCQNFFICPSWPVFRREMDLKMRKNEPKCTENVLKLNQITILVKKKHSGMLYWGGKSIGDVRMLLPAYFEPFNEVIDPSIKCIKWSKSPTSQNVPYRNTNENSLHYYFLWPCNEVILCVYMQRS